MCRNPVSSLCHVAKDAMTDADSRLRVLTAENERLTRALTEAGHHILALEKLAREDGLTGLLNRRSFDLELQRALDFHVRHGEDMALVLLDLDDFKGVNDRLGHAGGDAALKHVAKTLARNIRGSDIIARIGGDEFALILWRANADAGQHKIELLRRALETHAFDLAGRRIETSFSAGCAALTARQRSSEQWFAEADTRLYADKTRNKKARP
jgi:diguanylate cyclase (GGDEF)-like protein